MAASAGLRRWWIYQRERFPIVANGVLIAVVSLSALGYSAHLHGRTTVSWAGAVTAFVSAFLFFLQLRVADEFKDRDDDLAHRPYRPVPRGLVTLRELAVIGIAGGLIQLVMALFFEPLLLPLLLLVWAYLAIMTREFFVAEWLAARPLVYLATHMVVMPLIILYATAGDWRFAGEAVPDARIVGLLLFSLLNGVVVEIGRKVRAPQDEEAGVQTYSALYGPGRALTMWLVALLLAGVAALWAAAQVAFLWPLALLLVVVLLVAAGTARRFLEQQPDSGGKRFEVLSGLWTLAAYLMLGVAPLLLRPGAPL